MTAELDALRQHLSLLPRGAIRDPGELVSVLSTAWHLLDGGDAEGMTGEKLHDRIEDPSWDPPVLEFVIERHGGTVLGSSRAARHRWSVDVEGSTARCQDVGHRQLRPRAAPFDVKPIARDLSEAIRGGATDARLAWRSPDTVVVRWARALPPGVPSQTATGRRKRLQAALLAELEPDGWLNPRGNVFTRSKS